jgi:hypothetical protein
MQIEMQIKGTLDRLSIPMDVYCAIAGISTSRLSRAFRGLYPLTGPESIALTNVVHELEGLAQDALPYPVNFRDAAAIKTLIGYRRDGIRFIPTTRNMEDLSEARP